jgi:uncharacterized protein DUF3467
MADKKEANEQQAPTMQKLVSLKDDGYYANCSMLESTPFDVAILFGKVRPKSDESGQRSLVEVYERQVYLSHLQAKALYDALGRGLQALTQQQQQMQQQQQQQAQRTQPAATLTKPKA